MKTLLPPILALALLAAALPSFGACTAVHAVPPASALRADVDPAAPMVSHTVTFELSLPASEFNERMARAPLEAFMPGTAKLPGVVGTRALTERPFGTPGAPRLVCLGDGSTATEEVLESTPGRTFRYLVWNYSTEAARAIHYGIGTFSLTALDEQRTRVEWRYAFKLKDDRFPGSLGALGRWLMQHTFMDGDYAEMMNVTAEAMTRHFNPH